MEKSRRASPRCPRARHQAAGAQGSGLRAGGRGGHPQLGSLTTEAAIQASLRKAPLTVSLLTDRALPPPSSGEEDRRVTRVPTSVTTAVSLQPTGHRVISPPRSCRLRNAICEELWLPQRATPEMGLGPAHEEPSGRDSALQTPLGTLVVRGNGS